MALLQSSPPFGRRLISVGQKASKGSVRTCKWPLSGDTISARNEPLGGGVGARRGGRNPGETTQGDLRMVQPRDARKIPPEGALSECPSRNQNENQDPAPIWRDGGWGTKSARGHLAGWALPSARSAQLRLALLSLARPALTPPLGAAGRGGRYAAGRPLRGRREGGPA